MCNDFLLAIALFCFSNIEIRQSNSDMQQYAAYDFKDRIIHIKLRNFEIFIDASKKSFSIFAV